MENRGRILAGILQDSALLNAICENRATIRINFLSALFGGVALTVFQVHNRSLCAHGGSERLNRAALHVTLLFKT